MVDRVRSRAAVILVLVAALVGAGGAQGRSVGVAIASPLAASASPPTLAGATARVHEELQGIPQAGLRLGRARAPVEIIEYANLTCPACARAHSTVVPQLIRLYVRRGGVSLELRPIARDARSRALALGAQSASSQRHGWDFVQLGYLRPADEPARLVAALGLDRARWQKGLRNPAWPTLLAAAASVVRVARFEGDPVFLVRRRGHLGPFVVVTEPASLQDLATAIARARRA